MQDFEQAPLPLLRLAASNADMPITRMTLDCHNLRSVSLGRSGIVSHRSTSTAPPLLQQHANSPAAALSPTCADASPSRLTPSAGPTIARRVVRIGQFYDAFA